MYVELSLATHALISLWTVTWTQSRRMPWAPTRGAARVHRPGPLATTQRARRARPWCRFRAGSGVCACHPVHPHAVPCDRMRVCSCASVNVCVCACVRVFVSACVRVSQLTGAWVRACVRVSQLTGAWVRACVRVSPLTGAWVRACVRVSPLTGAWVRACVRVSQLTGACAQVRGCVRVWQLTGTCVCAWCTCVCGSSQVRECVRVSQLTSLYMPKQVKPLTPPAADRKDSV
jgi:hypothetical protein